MSKILVIDDDTIILNLLSIQLERNGYKVFTAFNGSEGIKLAKEIKPDLILCDILMPGMNGFEVLNKIQSDTETDLIPFIFISAVQEREHIREGINLGADDYLTKPIDIKDLIKSVETRLKKKERILTHLKSADHNKPLIKDKKRMSLNERIIINVEGNSKFIKVDDIVSLVAVGAKTKVLVSTGEIFEVNRLLKEWEKVLPEATFVRIHRSTIINQLFIQKVEKNESNTLFLHLLNVESPYITSRRFTPNLKRILHIL